jgi:hypothetical protein
MVIALLAYTGTRVHLNRPYAVYTTNYLKHYPFEGTDEVIPYLCTTGDLSLPCPPHYQTIRITWWILGFAVAAIFLILFMLLVYASILMTRKRPKQRANPKAAGFGWIRRMWNTMLSVYLKSMVDDHEFNVSSVFKMAINFLIHWVAAFLLGVFDIYAIILLAFSALMSGWAALCMSQENSRTSDEQEDQGTLRYSTHIKKIRFGHWITSAANWSIVLVIEIIYFCEYPHGDRRNLFYGMMIMEWIVYSMIVLIQLGYYLHLHRGFREWRPIRMLDSGRREMIRKNLVGAVQEVEGVDEEGNKVVYQIPINMGSRYEFHRQIYPVVFEWLNHASNLIRISLFFWMFYSMTMNDNYIPTLPSTFPF